MAEQEVAQPVEQPVEMVELSQDERRRLGCGCVRLDGVWRHGQGCPVPVVEQVLAERLAWLTGDRDIWQRLANEHAETAEKRMQRIGELLRSAGNPSVSREMVHSWAPGDPCPCGSPGDCPATPSAGSEMDEQ